MSPTCPSEPEILRFALRGAAGSESALASHLNECASCRARVAGLRRVICGIEASAGRREAAADGCLDEASLSEFVARRDASGRREAQIAHLAVCGHCRHRLSSLVELLGDPGIAAELGRLERDGTRLRALSGPLGAVGLVAAVVLLAVALPRGSDRRTPHRSPTITATATPAPSFPVGDVTAAAALRWAAVAGAERYRVTLFDSEGRVRYEAQTADTIAALPDSIGLIAGRSYLWKVEARTELERWASSELMEFRLTPSRSP